MPLTDTGLIVRYYIDEAASGSAPAAVLDGSGVGSAFDLTIDYGSGNLAYTEVSGQRGLSSSATTGTQRAQKTLVAGDKIITALNGSKTATMEVVLNVTSFSGSGGRVFGLTNRAGGTGEFMLRGTSATAWELAVKHYATVEMSVNLTESVRQVLHIVLDTNLSGAAIIKYAVDGGTLTSANAGIVLAQDQTLTVGDTLDLIMFNRESTGSYDRSTNGILYYAALYSSAFDQTRVNDHYAVLTADDDTPSVGRTAKNTRAFTHGVETSMNWRGTI